MWPSVRLASDLHSDSLSNRPYRVWSDPAWGSFLLLGLLSLLLWELLLNDHDSLQAQQSVPHGALFSAGGLQLDALRWWEKNWTKLFRGRLVSFLNFMENVRKKNFLGTFELHWGNGKLCLGWWDFITVSFPVFLPWKLGQNLFKKRILFYFNDIFILKKDVCHVGPWWGWRGLRYRGRKVGQMFPIFFVFSSICGGQVGSAALFAIQPHQHLGWKTNIWCHLRDPNVGRNILRVLLKWLW